MELEPAVRRIVNVVNKLDRRDETLPWSRRRQEGAAVSRRLRGLVMPPGPKMVSETNVPIAVDGGHINVRVYRPHHGRLPVLIRCIPLRRLRAFPLLSNRDALLEGGRHRRSGAALARWPWSGPHQLNG